MTFARILPEYADLLVPQEGQEFHVYIIKNRLKGHYFVGNALIDIYTNYGIVDIAHTDFEGMPQRGIVSWNLLMMGYGKSKKCSEANKLFCQKGIGCGKL